MQIHSDVGTSSESEDESKDQSGNPSAAQTIQISKPVVARGMDAMPYVSGWSLKKVASLIVWIAESLLKRPVADESVVVKEEVKRLEAARFAESESLRKV